METLRKHIERMRVVLCELSQGSLSRTVLEIRFIQKTCGSKAAFTFTFKFLVADGCIEKCGVEHRAPFRITEKGKAFLVWRGSND